MAVYTCKMCGGQLNVAGGETVATCEYCGTQQTLPRLEDERRANLYDRANHYRRNNDFDKAMGIYEQILTEDGTDAEAYWSLVLCRYGIEYVEDPATHHRVPTINRAQFTSVFDDDNYRSALQYADALQKTLYEQEAAAINEIQKGILAISQKEEPFDVFICYKETDASGRRTPDSVLATELYHELTRDGFKVFFSRITLEDKLGTAYEPYIFAALNSAKVMVVLGTKPEHFNAVWVKNEWSRYLSLIRQGQKKLLIPAYKDMDPYDLPEEFSHLQAQDMSKLGFMQDLIRGIKKIVEVQAPQATVVKETVVTGGAGTAPLLKRAFMFLEDGDWAAAEEYCEKVLDMDPECAEAYLGKLMAELRVRDRQALANGTEPLEGNNNYAKALRFGDAALKAFLEQAHATAVENRETVRLLRLYDNALSAMERAESEDYPEAYLQSAEVFRSLGAFRDAAQKVLECEKLHRAYLEKKEYEKKDKQYEDAVYTADRAVKEKNVASLGATVLVLKTLEGHRDAAELAAQYEAMIPQLEEAKRQEAARLAAERKKKRNRILAIVASVTAVALVAVMLFTVVIPNVKLSNGYSKAEALLNSGDEVAAAIAFFELGDYKDAAQRGATLWESIAARELLSAGEYHTVGLRADSTVVAVGSNEYGKCNKVSMWDNIVAVSGGDDHTVGLKADGTVVLVGGLNGDISGWRDIVAVSAGIDYTVGLKSDGTVVATGDNQYGQCDVSGWSDIIAVSAGDDHTVGLEADGTVVATGYKDNGGCNVSGWSDIVAVSAGGRHTVGLKSDGTVVAAGYNQYGQCDVSGWSDIIAVSAGSSHTVGLKADGTVVAVGLNSGGRCDVSGWRDIVAVSAGANHTIGLKADGTAVAVGDNNEGQCNVSDWKLRVPEK